MLRGALAAAGWARWVPSPGQLNLGAEPYKAAAARTGRGWKAAALTSSSALGSTLSSSMAGDTRTTSRMVCTGTIDCPSLARLRSSVRCRLHRGLD